jgi:hypothetical protein
MKKLLLYAVLSLIIYSCKNDDPTPIQLSINSFELNQNCFSAIKLQQAEVIITNAEDYKIFEDSIRVFWFPSCDTVYLPVIDFDSSFFAGIYTQVPGCSVSYESQVYFSAEQSLYNYIIFVNSIGNCERLNSAFNCAIIPRKSNQLVVKMNVEYR